MSKMDDLKYVLKHLKPISYVKDYVELPILPVGKTINIDDIEVSEPIAYEIFNHYDPTSYPDNPHKKKANAIMVTDVKGAKYKIDPSSWFMIKNEFSCLLAQDKVVFPFKVKIDKSDHWIFKLKNNQ